MQLDDLQRTLEAAIASGRIGTPVALTLHFEQPDPATDLAVELAALMDLARQLFGAEPTSLAARTGADESHWNLLFAFAAGQSAVLTLGKGRVARGRFQLLVVGNLGVIRLEGDEPLERQTDPPAEGIERWRTRLSASARADEKLAL